MYVDSDFAQSYIPNESRTSCHVQCDKGTVITGQVDKSCMQVAIAIVVIVMLSCSRALSNCPGQLWKVE